MPLHFKGSPLLAKKYVFPGDSGHRVDGQWEFQELPEGYEMKYVGWWMSEKYDGVRAMWNGENFVSRGGNVYHAPQWFKDQMPKSTGMDGELYAGPTGFQFVSGTVRHKRPVDKDWKKVTFMAFDLLNDSVMKKPFRERYTWLKEIVKEGQKKHGARNLALVEQHEIKSTRQAYDFYKSVLRKGGEGVVIRDPDAAYDQFRSCSLLKWKPQPEQEAVIVGYLEGKGKFKGMLGAFRAQMVDEKTKKPAKKFFKLAGKLSSEFRRQYRFDRGKLSGEPSRGSGYPVIGDYVTYEYMSMTSKGLPRQPVYIRIRSDWETSSRLDSRQRKGKTKKK